MVNNAGILRDRIFHRMSAVDWDAVIKVHLYGAFYVSKAAAPYFKDQESGSFIHFTSTSGLVGNFGQANYAAAKLGIVGLSKSIALDMARFNVRSNCVSPFAWSRLIGTIPVDTPEQKARVERVKTTMTASKIAPICVFLASDLAKDVTGQIFAVRKDEIFLMSQSRPVRVAHKDGGWTPAGARRHHAAGVQERALPARPLAGRVQLGAAVALRSYPPPPCGEGLGVGGTRRQMSGLPPPVPPPQGERGRCDALHPSIIAISVSSRSASAAGLSQRMRWMRGKRMATPDLWRVERCTASKATSNTSPGSTARTGPKLSVVWLRTQRSISSSSSSVKPK